MRILLAGYLLGQGGIQSHLRWLARALGEESIETLVLSFGRNECSIEDSQKLQSMKKSGIRIKFCTSYSKQKAPLGITKLQETAKIKSLIDEFQPDIYFAVGTGYNLFIPPLLSQAKTRCIFHEVMSNVPAKMRNPRYQWTDSRWFVRLWFDEVVGQSPNVAKIFAENFGWKKQLSVIPAIPEPLELTATLPQLTARKVEVGKARAALFSRLVPHKQAFWLVQQWDLMKDVLGELHIHGSGPEEQLIRDYIASRGLGDRVKCFGCYPEGQAYLNLLSSYDLSLLPTVGFEGSPLVLLESMACGVPFVAYGVGGIPDYGTNNPNVLVVPPQPDAFIYGVKQMVYKLAHGQIDRAKLQQFYLQHYSFAVLKKAWLSYLCDR